MKKGDKVPEDHIRCPRCFLKYGFVNCRYTTSSKEGVLNMCLRCVIQYKKS